MSDSTGSPIANESYSYDAYGVLLGGPRTTQTDLLYAGEMYDSVTDAYYLRARYYSPSTGRFNRIDPFAGNNVDPQSLHKYLYAHDNPVNGIDPSGRFAWIYAALVVAITRVFRAVRWMISGHIPSYYGNITKPLIEVCDKYDEPKCARVGVKNYDKQKCYGEAHILARRYYLRFKQWAEANPGYHMCTKLASEIRKMNLDSGLKYFSLARMTNIAPSPRDRKWFSSTFLGAHTTGVFHLCNGERGKSPATSDARLHPHRYITWVAYLQPKVKPGTRGWLID